VSAGADTDSRIGIEVLGLSNRSRNVLRRHGIETVQQLLSRSLKSLQKLEGFGNRATWEVCGALRRLGFSLTPEPVSGQKPSKASIAYLERLRDEFAIEAMGRLLRIWHTELSEDGEIMRITGDEGGTPDAIAEEAYAMADAMLKARSK